VIGLRQPLLDVIGTEMSVATRIVAENPETLPGGFALFDNYPNPFNPRTAVSYQLTAISFVRLGVYDGLGREVATLVNEEKPAGLHTVTWIAQDFPSGVYVCRLIAGGRSDSRKMLLVK